METDTLPKSISAEEMLQLILKAPSLRSFKYHGASRPSDAPSPGGCKPEPPGALVWRVHLSHDDRPDADLAFEVQDDVVLGIGLNPDDDPDIDLKIWEGYELGVSRRHLMLRATDNNLFAVDLSTTNGSMLNGLPMTPSRAYELADGDLLSLARLHLRVVRVDRVPAARPEALPRSEAGLAVAVIAA